MTAEHFAAVQGQNSGGDAAVLQYSISSKALSILGSSGAHFRPVAGGQRFTPGYEYYVPPSAFGTFNSLRKSGNILVGPVE